MFISPGTLWVYRSLHRALGLLRAWAEEDAGKKKGECPPERFAEDIQWFLDLAVPAIFNAFDDPLEDGATDPLTLLQEDRWHRLLQGRRMH